MWRQICLLLIIMAGAAAAGRLAPAGAGAGAGAPRELAGHPSAQDISGTPVVYLPLSLRAVALADAIRAMATARAGTAQAATATARARPSASPSPSASEPSPTPSIAGSPTATATGQVSASPSASASHAASPSVTPSATSGTPTRTPPTPSTSATPRDPAGESLRPLGADRSGEIDVAYDEALRTYVLTYRGDVTIQYELELTHPDNAAGRLAVREAESGRYPLAGAGLYYLRRDGALIEPRFFGLVGAVDSVAHELLADGVRLTVSETLEGRPHTKSYTISLVGRSLRIRAESLDGRAVAIGAYAGVTAGDIEGTADGLSVRLPYMDAVPITMLDHRWFVSSLIDYPASRAGELVPRGPEVLPGGFANEVAALYPADVSGWVRAVDETVWLTLSPDVTDVFAVPDNAPSPYRGALASSVHVTLTGRPSGIAFADEAAYLAQLGQWGVDDLIVHKRHWRDATVLRPAQGPPDPAAGGEAGFGLLGAATRGVIAPAGAFTVTDEPCPGESNPLYRPSDRVSGADGSPKRLAAAAGGTRECGGGVAAGRFLLAPDAAVRIARGESMALAALGAGAITLPSAAAWNPGYPFPGADENGLDRATRPTHPATVGESVLAFKRLFADLQANLGPVFGAGAAGLWELGYDSFYAGYVDGVARSLSTGSREETSGAAYLVVPDYELTVIRPRMVNYGMGDYDGFFGLADRGDDDRPAPALSEDQVDEWRSTTLAYGHAGAWLTSARSGPDGGSYLTPAEEVKAYYLMRPLQMRYLDAPLVSVGYVGADSRERNLTQALAEDMDLAGPQLHLAYGGGLSMWINHSPNLWPVTAGAETYLLPTHGWLARDPDGLLAYSALVEGRRVDYLSSSDWIVLDGRGEMAQFGPLDARDLKVVFPDGRSLEEQADGSLLLKP